MDGSSGRDNGLPSICGSEELVDEATRAARDHPAFVSAGAVSGRSFGYMRSAFGVTLHMHQLLIPAGGNDLRTAPLVSNLQHMLNKATTRTRCVGVPAYVRLRGASSRRAGHHTAE